VIMACSCLQWSDGHTMMYALHIIYNTVYTIHTLQTAA